jgi:hypothetical protein
MIDLAVLNNTDKNVSILTGDGSGGFTASTTKYATGRGAVGIVATDFNGDGYLDLAAANGTDGTISILLGKGDGTFDAQVSYSLSIISLIPTAPSTLVIGDFNGDGIPDIAVGGTNLLAGGIVDILQGDGNGTFTNVTTLGIGVGAGPSSIVAGDFNGDGNLDFAVANLFGNTISVMRGDGSGSTFTAASGSPFNTGGGTSPAAIAVADFNGDGQLDLAIAESNKNGSTSLKETATAPLRCSRALLQQGRSLWLSRRETSMRTVRSTLLSQTSLTTQPPSCWATALEQGSRPLQVPRSRLAAERPHLLRWLQRTLTGTAAPIWQSQTAIRTT